MKIIFLNAMRINKNFNFINKNNIFEFLIFKIFNNFIFFNI